MRRRQLPPQSRGHFVQRLQPRGEQWLRGRAGPDGWSVNLPASVPAQVAQQIAQSAHGVFTHGFVDAMRPTLVLPIAIVALAALCAFAVHDPKRARSDTRAEAEATIAS